MKVNTRLLIPLILIALFNGCATTSTTAPVQPRYMGDVSSFEANRSFDGLDYDGAYNAIQNAYRSLGFKITDLDEREGRVVAAMGYSGKTVQSYAQLYETQSGVTIRLNTKVPQEDTKYSDLNEQIFQALLGR